ncbi:HNH/endonuclease VII fold putative polymorphic toxin [Rosenbergiella epipactidis]|uniref:HNH/endonuclease VII fold putative polymorphic toxin n=1 Tax=Rosenbergiella epipactidis TaxID=1544694 RepID=UPI0030C874AC
MVHSMRKNGNQEFQWVKIRIEYIPNVDKRGNPQPGKIYEFDVPKPGGGTQTIQIRDDAKGHFFGEKDIQNRGPHFNDQEGNHYDY